MKSKAKKEGGDTAIARVAMRFVLMIGALSLFSDFTHEGARSILGPYLASVGATAFVVGAVTGFGEFLGYGLRLVSGRLADVTGKFWPITIFGYAVQMAAVPALALTHTWPEAAVLIILERAGRAIRIPPRDVMLSHAAGHIGGYGWTFGIHQACDQAGAMLGPLIVAVIMGWRGQYHEAFAILLIPAIINLALVMIAKFLYPNPEAMETSADEIQAPERFSSTFWIYMLAGALVAIGFADYPLVAFHFTKTHSVPTDWIAGFYAVAMAVSGAGSMLFGRLYDRFGFRLLAILTVVAATFAPLVFLGSFWPALFGAAVWGLGMGVHESIIPAALTPLVPRSKRASAFGLFSSAYGAAWFVGSAAIGFLYDRSLTMAVAFCVVTQLLAVPIFLWLSGKERGLPRGHPQV